MSFDFKRAFQATAGGPDDDPPETREILVILPHTSVPSFCGFLVECWPAFVHTLAQSHTHSLLCVFGFGGSPSPFSTAKHIEQYLMASDAVYVTQQPVKERQP